MPPTLDQLRLYRRDVLDQQENAARMNAIEGVDPARARADSNLRAQTNFPLPIWDETTRDMAQTRLRQDQVGTAAQQAPALAPWLSQQQNYALAADDLHPLANVSRSLDNYQLLASTALRGGAGG